MDHLYDDFYDFYIDIPEADALEQALEQWENEDMDGYYGDDTPMFEDYGGE